MHNLNDRKNRTPDGGTAADHGEPTSGVTSRATVPERSDVPAPHAHSGTPGPTAAGNAAAEARRSNLRDVLRASLGLPPRAAVPGPVAEAVEVTALPRGPGLVSDLDAFVARMGAAAAAPAPIEQFFDPPPISFAQSVVEMVLNIDDLSRSPLVRGERVFFTAVTEVLSRGQCGDTMMLPHGLFSLAAFAPVVYEDRLLIPRTGAFRSDDRSVLPYALAALSADLRLHLVGVLASRARDARGLQSNYAVQRDLISMLIFALCAIPEEVREVLILRDDILDLGSPALRQSLLDSQRSEFLQVAANLDRTEDVVVAIRAYARGEMPPPPGFEGLDAVLDAPVWCNRFLRAGHARHEITSGASIHVPWPVVEIAAHVLTPLLGEGERLAGVPAGQGVRVFAVPADSLPAGSVFTRPGEASPGLSSSAS